MFPRPAEESSAILRSAGEQQLKEEQEQEQDFPGILARNAPMNLEMRKCLIINDCIFEVHGEIKSKKSPRVGRIQGDIDRLEVCVTNRWRPKVLAVFAAPDGSIFLTARLADLASEAVCWLR